MQMRLNVEHLQEVLNENQWSRRKFAMKAGLSPATVSRILNEKRGAGAKTIGAIHRVLPEESLEKIFTVDRPAGRYVTANVTAKGGGTWRNN